MKFITTLILLLCFFIFQLFLDKSFAIPIELEKENILGTNDSETLIKKSGLLTLKEALDLAMENNHHIKSAIATLPIQEANLIIAKYRPNPIINSNDELVKGGSIHPLQLGQTLELGRKRHWRIEIAKQQISKTELEIRKILWEIHTQVHIAYADLAIGLELFNLAKARTDFYKSLAEIAQKRFIAGDVSKLELDRTNMQFLSAENELSKFEGRLKKSNVNFNHELGLSPDSDTILEGSDKSKPRMKLNQYQGFDKIVDEALQKRLEIAILEKDFGIKRSELKKAQWDRLPNFYIEGSVVKPSFRDNIWGPYIGGQFELPVFNRKQGEIKQARAQIEYLQKEEERIKHDIKIDVANAVYDVEITEQQIQRFEEKLLSNSTDILEMIKTAYEKGKLSLTDVLNAEQQNRDLRQNYLESLLNYQVSLASLEYATGTPLKGLTEE